MNQQIQKWETHKLVSKYQTTQRDASAMKRNGIPTDNIGYSEICKAIRQKIKEDIYQNNKKWTVETIENSKSFKQARQNQRLKKGQLISSMEEDRTHIHNEDLIMKRYVAFYKELYALRRASVNQDSHGDPTTTSTIDPPSLLPWEVEATIKRLKRNQAPGEDNITGGIL